MREATRGPTSITKSPRFTRWRQKIPSFVGTISLNISRIPLSTRDGRRNGVTEFIYATKAHPVYGANLTIWEETLVTKVKFDDGRAQGLEYFKRKRTYRADRDDTKLDHE
jgi:hypothetical protein